jgi:hypothetical protein
MRDRLTIGLSLKEVRSIAFEPATYCLAEHADEKLKQVAKQLLATMKREERLREALKQIERYPRLPITDIADSDAQQLRDARSALNIMCFIANQVLADESNEVSA